MQCFEEVNNLLFLPEKTCQINLPEKSYGNLHQAEVWPLLLSWLNQLCIYL